MGVLNVIKGKWDGKVGQLVGAKWKNLATLRAYAKPSNPNTEKQQTVRTVFKDMTSFTSLFTDMIKYLTSLDTRGQSVRNAILKINKAQVDAGTFNKATLLVNKGGLPNVTGFTVGTVTAGSAFDCTFTAPVATNITSKARIVVVAVDGENKIAGVGDALLSTGTVNVNISPVSGGTLDIYYWIIDYRGSSRVGSYSGYTSKTV